MTARPTLSEPTRITDQVWADDVTPAVSVFLMTYNHSSFIRDAIDGILAQQTTFRVEIAVHDDASTDDTLPIIEQYASAHPGLFRIIAQTENQFSKRISGINALMNATSSEYVALCEGDDYWSSNDKLLSQVALLDSRPRASACIHRADGLFEESEELRSGFFGPDVPRSEYEVDDFLRRDNFVPTVSILLRRSSNDLPPWLGEVPHGDIVILCNAALSGPVLHIERSMAVYRKHRGGLHTKDVTAMQALNCVRTLLVIGQRLGVSHRESFREGMKFRLGQIEGETRGYEQTLQGLKDAHEKNTREIRRILESRTFRLGMALRSLRHRTSPSAKQTG